MPAVPLADDDEVCFCFHVTLRKVRSFCRVEKPQVASQISQCLSAGTGCGWCRPMLRRIHRQECPDAKEPWWRQVPDGEQGAANDYQSPERNADAAGVDPEAYASGRQTYLKETGRKPPPTPAP
jgi:bacterioferritin-associated ferredoxin